MIYRDLGHRRNEAYALLGLGRVRLATGEFQLAGELLEPAMALFQEFGDRPGRANTLLELGRLAHARKDFPAAAELFDRPWRSCANTATAKWRPRCSSAWARSRPRPPGPRRRLPCIARVC